MHIFFKIFFLTAIYIKLIHCKIRKFSMLANVECLIMHNFDLQHSLSRFPHLYVVVYVYMYPYICRAYMQLYMLHICVSVSPERWTLCKSRNAPAIHVTATHQHSARSRANACQCYSLPTLCSATQENTNCVVLTVGETNAALFCSLCALYIVFALCALRDL